MSSTLRNINDVLLRAARFQVAVLIWKAHNRIDAADINPLRIGPRGIKRNAVWPLQSWRESFHLLRLAVCGNSAKNLHITWIAFSDEKIAVRRRHDQSRIIQPARILLDGETWQRFRPCITRTRHHFGAVV